MKDTHISHVILTQNELNNELLRDTISTVLSHSLLGEHDRDQATITTISNDGYYLNIVSGGEQGANSQLLTQLEKINFQVESTENIHYCRHTSPSYIELRISEIIASIKELIRNKEVKN